MTAFEFVFALVSIITSLTITHMLTGLVNVLRNRKIFQISLVHALWGWSALLLAIGNWASFWGMRSNPSWAAWTVLLNVTVMIAQYVFCALVTPEIPHGVTINREDSQEQDKSRFTLAAAVFFSLAIAANTALGGAGFYESWARDNVVSILGLVLAVIAYAIRAPWLQLAVAAAFLLLNSYYAIVTCNVVTN